MQTAKNLFLSRLKELNIDLTSEQISQFDSYYEMLVETNKVMNLTAITEYEDVLLKHFIDSLSVFVVPQFRELVSNDCRMIDVGTGAGFPGIPIKIAFPDISVDLLDSLNKRITFLQNVIREVGLSDIAAYHGRAEDYAHKVEFREVYDLCVSRAVANLTTLSEYCLPFIKKDGLFIALKSGSIEEELTNSKNAIRLLGAEIVEVIPFVLPQSDIERSFVVIKKISATSKKYPRKAGLPAREPLK